MDSGTLMYFLVRDKIQRLRKKGCSEERIEHYLAIQKQYVKYWKKYIKRYNKRRKYETQKKE